MAGPTKNTIYLISLGSNIYLSGGGSTQVPHAMSGSEWTAESTTPYTLALNDVTGNAWAMPPATAHAVYGGGPPLGNGRRLANVGYDNVTETVGLQLKATSKDMAVELLRYLRQALNTALHGVPCILAIQGGTNTAYFEIYSGDVAELPSYLYEGSSTAVTFRTTVTWTRSWAGTLRTTPETLINGNLFANTGTGSPDNIDAYTAGSGEFIYRGSPLNLKIDPSTNFNISNLYAGSIYSRTYDTTGASTYATSSTTGAFAYSTTFTLTSVLTRVGLKPRVMLRASASSSITEVQFKISAGSGTAFTSNWVPAGGSSALLDLGTFPIELIRQSQDVTTPVVTVNIWTRSTSGASASITTTYQELILYYDWCHITLAPGVAGGYTFNTGDVLYFDVFPQQSGSVLLPFRTPRVFVIDSSGVYQAIAYVAGQAPRYYSGASLYLGWTNTGNAHVTTQQCVVTATHAPIYLTIRGGG